MLPIRLQKSLLGEPQTIAGFGVLLYQLFDKEHDGIRQTGIARKQLALLLIQEGALQKDTPAFPETVFPTLPT